MLRFRLKYLYQTKCYLHEHGWQVLKWRWQVKESGKTSLKKRREEEMDFCLWMAAGAFSFFYYYYCFFIEGGPAGTVLSESTSKIQPCKPFWFPYESAGHWAVQTVQPRVNGQELSLDTPILLILTLIFFFNYLYVTWCLTSELASKTAAVHLHQRLRPQCGSTLLQLFYWLAQLD